MRAGPATPAGRPAPPGSAAARTARTEPSYRAAYLLNAARRIRAGLQGGQPLPDAVTAEFGRRLARCSAAAVSASARARFSVATRRAVSGLARPSGPSLDRSRVRRRPHRRR